MDGMKPVAVRDELTSGGHVAHLGGDAVRVDIRRGEGDSVRLVSISNAPGL